MTCDEKLVSINMTTGSLLLDGEVRGIFDNHNKINWDNDVVWRKSGKHIYRTLIMFTTEWINVFKILFMFHTY